jgi:hypothetical protein
MSIHDDREAKVHARADRERVARLDEHAGREMFVTYSWMKASNDSNPC